MIFGTLGRILVGIINIYIIILTIRIILSWLVLPHSRITYYLNSITDPVINYAKKVFPFRIGIIDLSIIFPFIILSLLSMIINDLMVLGVPLSIYYIIEVFIIALDMIFNFITTVITICAVILIFLNFLRVNTYNPLVTAIRSFIDPITITIHRIIRINSKYADKIYLIIVIILMIVIGSAGHWLLTFILNQVKMMQVNEIKVLSME